MSSEEWTDAAIKSLSDDNLKQLLQNVAVLFKTLKDDAIRRGIWDEMKGRAVDSTDVR